MLGPLRVASELGGSGKLKMLALYSPRRWTIMMLLSMHMLSSPIFTYPVVLSIVSTTSTITIALGMKTGSGFGDKFETCVCNKRTKGICEMPVKEGDQYMNTLSESLTADNAATYRQDKVYQCEYKAKQVQCTLIKTSSCPFDSCTINMIIECPATKNNVVVSWESTQQPSVLNSSDIKVIDCCKSSTTTTEETTTRTSLPSTTFTSANPTTDPTTTTFTDGGNKTNAGIPHSTSPTPDNITLNITYAGTSNQQVGYNHDSSHISWQNIGIIVGTAVAAIMITIVIMCIFWKLKTRRDKNRKTEKLYNGISIARNVEETQVDQVRNLENQQHKKTSKTIAVVSPLDQSGNKQNYVAQTVEDYTYIDINSAATATSKVALTSQCPKLENNHQVSTTAEAGTVINDTEYSHLGTHNAILHNPYNGVYRQTHSATTQPVIVQRLPVDEQQLSHYLQTSNFNLTSTDQQISQETQHTTGADEGNNLYSNLGESKLPLENTYNSLHNLNGGQMTEPSFSQNSGKSHPTTGRGPETTASQNHKLQLFSHTLNHKNVDIVDVAPYTYTEVTLKTTREKSNDGNHLMETNHKTILTSSNNDHLVAREVTVFETPTVINVTKENKKGSKKMSKTIDDECQVYANAVNSMHENPHEGNSSFSLDDGDYANL